MRLGPSGLVDLPVLFDRAEVDLVKLLDVSHHLSGSIPTVHQNRPEGQFLLIMGAREHLAEMIDFGLSVDLRVVDSIVDAPELIGLWIDVDAGYDADAPDHALFVAAPLASDCLDFSGVVFVQNRVVEKQVALLGRDDLVFDLFPEEARRDLLPLQVAIDLVMAPLLGVVSEVGD